MICQTMNQVLERWNLSDAEAAAEEVLPCCGSGVWARMMTAARPLTDEDQVVAAADRIWRTLPEEARLEAFASHPRIGQREAPQGATAISAAWSGEEQRTAMLAEDRVKSALQMANERYELRFGRVFLVCADGRSAGEILAELERRMANDAYVELMEAAEEQRKITELRLRRWMGAR